LELLAILVRWIVDGGGGGGNGRGLFGRTPRISVAIKANRGARDERDAAAELRWRGREGGGRGGREREQVSESA
jgi:hypothetical protein